MNANIKKTDITTILDKTEFKVNQRKVKENESKWFLKKWTLHQGR